MAEDKHNSVRRVRVNAALLEQYYGKPVCLLGTVIKADGGGTAFQMKGCDGGGPINIRLKTPISEPLSGLVEVCGIGQGKDLILAEFFTAFPESISKSFDLTTYNEAVKLMQAVANNVWIPV